MAKSKSGEFYSFDEVLRQLNIDENRLKRLVSEGEIRAFREGDAMRFKRSEIDSLAGRTGRGSQTSDTSLTEISLEEESQPTVNVAGAPETLADDLTGPSATGGMRTAEISSQDTFIDQAEDIGMSTEPIDFTEEEGEEAEEIEDMGVDRARRGIAAPPPRRRPPVEEAHTGALMILVLVLTFIIGIFGVLLVKDISEGPPLNSMSQWFADEIGGAKQEE
ncbi:MAG: helix-turn-helix domain-containing protein [Planctomycetota bacterium]